jgi:hypothetical protein
MSTLTLETDGWTKEINPLDMLPGDALGLLGHGSVGSDGGTIVLFENWLNNDHTTGYAMTWEMLPDTSPGPVRRARPFDRNKWHCYRFRDITDE